MLARHYNVRITTEWPDALAHKDSAMLALHARKSADAIRAWHKTRGNRGLAVVLTGTDLYQDIFSDRRAKQSLEWAQALVVLQSHGLVALPAPHRPKARVIYQSAPQRAPLKKTDKQLRVVAVGHLRAVKSPHTYMEAARLLAEREDIRFHHIGQALSPEWEEAALNTMLDCPNYHWLEGQSHGRARLAIQRAHVLVHPSAMEGGAHVILEAVRSGTPVLASRVGGNIGMLGEDYEGYFNHSDAKALARLIKRCRDDRGGKYLERLRAQCDARADLFTPEAEQAGLLQLTQDLIA